MEMINVKAYVLLLTLLFAGTIFAASSLRGYYIGKPSTFTQTCDGTNYNDTWTWNAASVGGTPGVFIFRVCLDNSTCTGNITHYTTYPPSTNITIRLLRRANGTFELNTSNDTPPSPALPVMDICPVSGHCVARVESSHQTDAGWEVSDWMNFTGYTALCATPFLIQTHSRNATDSNVSFQRVNVPASQTVNCSVNATTDYSFANKTCSAANGTNCTVNFAAETEVSNVTLQYGKAVCSVPGGNPLPIYSGCTDCSYLSMMGQNWTWALGMDEEWKITNAAGEWDKVDLNPRITYSGMKIRGIWFKVVSRWDGLDHPGIYSAYLNFTLPPQCTMPYVTEFPVYGLDKYAGSTGPIVYGVNFQNAASTYILCTSAANITLDMIVSRHPFQPLNVIDERSTNITLEVKPAEFTIDNVQAFNNSGTVDYWATVSYKYTRYPVPLNTTCNLTVDYENTTTATYAGSLRIDSLTSPGDITQASTNTFSSFFFDANATDADVKGATWTVACGVP